MADMTKLVDVALLGKFKAKQDALFQKKLDEKEALGTAAKLVGDLTTLKTTAQGTAVAAINEVVASVAALSKTHATDKAALEKSITAVDTKVGDLTTLTTDVKTSVITAINEVDANADAAKAAADAAQKKADQNAKDLAAITGTGAGGIDKKIEDAVKTVTDSIGDKTTLTTDEKGTIVGAINEVDANVDALKTSSAVTVDFDDTTRIYKISQGGTLLGTMNIGKDLVVSSGEVKEVAEKGTCLVLTLTSGDVVNIPVASLIDIYTAAAGAKEVQIAIDSATRQVSATLVEGGVATAKIADLAVTKGKLATAVQGSLDKADTAVQKADVTTGSAVGTISVQKTDVAVNGFADLKATVDKLDGDATVAGSVDKKIADAKSDIKTTTDALGNRAKALEDWKAGVSVATDEDLEGLFS